MRRSLIASAAAALACATALGAQAPSPGRAASEALAVQKARADSARYPYTAADIQFMQGMIHHHAQAIQMSKMAPTHGASPAVLTLCNRIINAQTDEINFMSMWLRDRKQDVPDPTPGPMTMQMGGMEHEMLMPGMLSAEQMQALDAARGQDFDRLFLEGMIQHHTGAVSMVHDLEDSFGADQDLIIQKLSQDIQVDQTTEIARMKKMHAEILLGMKLP